MFPIPTPGVVTNISQVVIRRTVVALEMLPECLLSTAPEKMLGCIPFGKY